MAKYQCYYHKSVFFDTPDGRSRPYIGEKVLTESFDNEVDAERYCRNTVGSQKTSTGYIENEMMYEEVEA